MDRNPAYWECRAGEAEQLADASTSYSMRDAYQMVAVSYRLIAASIRMIESHQAELAAQAEKPPLG